MYTSVNVYDFVDAFRKMGREEQFSRAGLNVLFDYLEDYEEETGERIELDVISICCDYAEYTLEDLRREYDINAETLDDAAEYLNEHTMVCGMTEDSIVFLQF